MNREIKFRFWTGGMMLKVTKITWEGRYMPIAWIDGEWNGASYGMDKGRGVLLEYTGLKDKNGKEIYEGDILQDSKKVRAQIRWCEDMQMLGSGFYALSIKPETPFDAYERSWLDIAEVIGNIWETPELLNQLNQR